MYVDQPEPLQPADTSDTIRQVVTEQLSPAPYEMWSVERVQFECARCHTLYWRAVVHQEVWTEVLEIEGVGTYPVNPHVEHIYAPNPHQCSEE